jgi:hypothetical protein
MDFLFMAGGRPVEYKEEYCEQVEKLCKLGATDKEIADFFGVSERTINRWKKEYEGFCQSIKKGKIIADAEVASALHKRAVGYQYDEVTFEKIGPGEELTEVGEEGMEAVKQDLFKKRVITKEVPPDVAAANIWLKNRRGRVVQGAQRWADKVENGFTDSEGNDVPVHIFQLPDNGRTYQTKDNSTARGLSDEVPE